MPIALTGYVTLIASPGDTADERAAVREALTEWNITRGRRDAVSFLPWLYEHHAVPRMGGRAQQVINEQAVDQCDIVVAFFDSRLGTATGVDVSGTAEEIGRAIDAGKQVHVYFSTEPLPRDADLEQLAALKEFKADLQAKGLLGDYSDPADLAGQVVRAVEDDLSRLEPAVREAVTPEKAAAQGARLRWEHVHNREPQGVDKRGKMKYRTTANHLIVTNEGDAEATALTFTVEPIGDTSFTMPDEVVPLDLTPGSQASHLLIPTPSFGDSGSNVRVEAAWTEEGEPRSGQWQVTLKS